MTEPRADDKAALEQVIRAFSDAEVALQEIAGEAQRVKSAAQQLDLAKIALEFHKRVGGCLCRCGSGHCHASRVVRGSTDNCG